MDRLRRILRRRSAKVVSMGAESSRGPGQEDLGPACHDKEGPIKARRWLCPVCCQRKRAAPDSRTKEERKPTTSQTRWRWPWVRLRKQELAPQQRQTEELCSSPCMAWRSLEPDPAAPQQEAAPCRAEDEGPFSLGQELSESCTSPSLSCGSSWDDLHSSLESGSTSPSRDSSLGNSNSSLESRNSSPSPSSSSGDSDSSLESPNTSSSSSSSEEEDTPSSLERGTTPAPGASRTGVEEGAGEGPRETPADRALVLARAAWPHLCPPCPTSLPLSGPGLTLSPFLPTAVIPRPATEDEDEDEEEDEDGSPPEEAARLLVIKHLQEPGQRLDGKDGQRFLLAILTLSTVAEQSTEVAMQLEGLKVPMVEKIVVSTMQHGMVWREGRRGETVSWDQVHGSTLWFLGGPSPSGVGEEQEAAG
ncbi:PREDICTED: mucin-5AC-like [Gavialis gangeticus]|uniref:mucin-5AC-like n=1 Tax=Gavialis gangeticus TaxID=94835 RepID=UPI00092E95DD|nr:PREDICTED: mucin-5AC-like [Gavialis gangeticus]